MRNRTARRQRKAHHQKKIATCLTFTFNFYFVYEMISTDFYRFLQNPVEVGKKLEEFILPSMDYLLLTNLFFGGVISLMLDCEKMRL